MDYPNSFFLPSLFFTVSQINIERVASVFKLCWDLFKLALLSYTVEKAFQALGYILTHLIKFLQESRFFSKLRELGGWVSPCVVVLYKS